MAINMTGKTKYIMVQGTMSGAGKSLIVAALCRIFSSDGYRVAPFKSQNMALNSYVTKDGLEMGRAQVMQAYAAGIEPSVYMNPILLKPTDDIGSQVIVNGEVIGNMPAREYFEYKRTLIPEIKDALCKLEQDYEIIVIEGAGSPAEINLKENDIVNMGMAKIADAPVILVGDIDSGGVFAQLYGTVELLEKEEKDRICGFFINKFRGDISLLDSGIDIITEKTGINTLGVIPYMDLHLEDEDSLSSRFYKKADGKINIAIIRLPHISNYTDFDMFEQLEEVSVSYVNQASELDSFDMVIIPGTKSTIADLEWIYKKGLHKSIHSFAEAGGPVFGICGGYQMLGETIVDDVAAEGGGRIEGLGLLPVNTHMCNKKKRSQVKGILNKVDGVFSKLTGASYSGYEIHMGQSSIDTVLCNAGNVYGGYVHGIFDSTEISHVIIKALADRKGVNIDLSRLVDRKAYMESDFNKLEKTVREHIDMTAIYKVLGL